MRFMVRTALLTIVGLGVCAADAAAAGANSEAGKIPITTKSAEARALYLKGRALFEALRATDAHREFKAAVAKDPDFALGAFMLANTAQTGKEFFEEIGRAAALADKASEPERLLILGNEAGVKGDVARQHELLTKLIALVPNDERAHSALGNVYFGQQDYPAAIAEYEKAISINPKFTQSYNQLGYAYRFTERFPEAEKTFKKYIELIPNDPNPYDSYAELLMKMGRFEDSIRNYQRALKIDRNFIASWVGIGNDQMFMGKFDEARQSFGKVTGLARSDGEKRIALFWTAIAYVHEGKVDEALAEVGKESAVAEAGNDLGNLAADHNFMGNILLEGGRPDQAAAEFDKQLEINAKAQVPEENKQAVRRNDLFDRSRVALAKKDVATAKKIADDYAKQVAEKKIPFEVRQSHELLGMIAIEEKRYDDAVTELASASQQDPRVLYLTAVALYGKGDAAKAKALCAKAADWNSLFGNYAYVRQKAKDLLGKIVG